MGKKSKPKPMTSKGPMTVGELQKCLDACVDKKALVTITDHRGAEPETINKCIFIYDSKGKVDEVQLFGAFSWRSRDVEEDDDDEDGDGPAYGALEESEDGCSAVLTIEDGTTIADAVRAHLANCSGADTDDVDVIDPNPAIQYLKKPDDEPRT